MIDYKFFIFDKSGIIRDVHLSREFGPLDNLLQMGESFSFKRGMGRE